MGGARGERGREAGERGREVGREGREAGREGEVGREGEGRRERERGREARREGEGSGDRGGGKRRERGREALCADFDILNGTVMAMISNFDLQNDMTNDHLQNFSIRILELETDRNEHNNVIHVLTKYVSYLNETLMQVADEENYQNHSFNTNEEAMSLSYHARMTSLETNLMLTNATLAQLQTDQLNNVKMITNHTSRVMHLETSIEKLSSTAGLENRLILLESDLNETKTDIEENSIMIQMLEMNDTIFRAFIDNQLQRNNEFETNLSSIYEAYKNYNESVGRIKVNT